jgi:hypothetical protein
MITKKYSALHWTVAGDLTNGILVTRRVSIGEAWGQMTYNNLIVSLQFER